MNKGIFMVTVSTSKSNKIHKNAFILKLIAFFAMLTVCSSAGMAQLSYTPEEEAMLDNYAMILGYAHGCGINTDAEFAKVHEWVKKRTAAGYPDQGRNFVDNSATHNSIQRDFGQYPLMDCDDVKETFQLPCQKKACTEVRKIFDETEFNLP